MREQTNLLEETIDVLGCHNKTEKDVLWVETYHGWYSWEKFRIEANRNYDNSYGGNEVRLDLKVVGENFWLERHEYDGSEWWEYKERKGKPERELDTLNIFDIGF